MKLPPEIICLVIEYLDFYDVQQWLQIKHSRIWPTVIKQFYKLFKNYHNDRTLHRIMMNSEQHTLNIANYEITGYLEVPIRYKASLYDVIVPENSTKIILGKDDVKICEFSNGKDFNKMWDALILPTYSPYSELKLFVHGEGTIKIAEFYHNYYPDLFDIIIADKIIRFSGGTYGVILAGNYLNMAFRNALDYGAKFPGKILFRDGNGFIQNVKNQPYKYFADTIGSA